MPFALHSFSLRERFGGGGKEGGREKERKEEREGRKREREKSPRAATLGCPRTDGRRGGGEREYVKKRKRGKEEKETGKERGKREGKKEGNSLENFGKLWKRGAGGWNIKPTPTLTPKKTFTN